VQKFYNTFIFTSAYYQYAIKAFELNSVDYLLKPFDKKALERTKNKLSAMKKPLVPQVDMDAISSLIRKTTQSQVTYKYRFTTKFGQRIRTATTAEIVCFYSEDKATWVQTNAGRSNLVDYTLEELQSMLDSKVFYRVNRKYIIHVDHIEEIHQYSNSRLRVMWHNFKNTNIIVSRERVKSFRA